MNFAGSFDLVRSGRRMRRECWPPGWYVQSGGDITPMYRVVTMGDGTQYAAPYGFNFDDASADDWATAEPS